MQKIKLLIVLALVLLTSFVPSLGKASLVGTASQSTLSLLPATGSYSPNDTFTVSVLMNTNGQSAVVSSTYLSYDRNSFQVVSVDVADSVFSMGIEKIIDANTGTIKITRGSPTPGVNSASALIAKINFKALYGTTPSADNLTFKFAIGDNNQSTVIKDNGQGTNMLSGVYNAKHTVSGAPNPSPIISTPTPTPNGGGGGTNPTSTPTPFNNPTPTPLPSGQLPSNGTLIKTSDSPRVYVMIQGKKKWIATPEVFETLGYKWTAIAVITKEVLARIPDYEDNLIRANGDIKVYMVVNGIRHHIPNPEIFLDYGFAWSDVKDVPQSTIDKYRLVRLIRESGQSKIYYLSAAGIKKWVPTVEIFDSYNNKWADIQVISNKELVSYPESNLMKLIGASEIYLIEDTTKRLIPTETVFYKNNYDWAKVLDANQLEFNWYQTGTPVE